MQSYWQIILLKLCKQLAIATEILPNGIRVRTTATNKYVFNYNAYATKYKDQEIEAAAVIWD